MPAGVYSRATQARAFSLLSGAGERQTMAQLIEAAAHEQENAVKSAMICLKVSPTMATALQRCANVAGIQPQEFIRRSLRERLESYVRTSI